MDIDEREEPAAVRFLLGEVPEAEREEVEQRCLKDDRYFEDLCALEDSLIDDYVCDRLSPDLRKRVENRLANSVEWQERVAFTQSLATMLEADRDLAVASPQSPGGSRWSIWTGVGTVTYVSFATACVAIALAGFLAVKVRQLDDVQRERERRQDEAGATLAAERERGNQLAEQLLEAQRNIASLQSAGVGSAANREAAGRSAARALMVAITLEPGLRRETSSVLGIPANAGVRLQLDLPIDRARKLFRATLTDSARRQAWSADVRSVEQDAKAVVILELPGDLLAEDEYTLVLEARDQVLTQDFSYSFSVVRR